MCQTAIHWQDIVYCMKHDPTLRTTMRKPDSLNETLAIDVIKDALSAITKQSAVERGEVVDSRASLENAEDAEDTVDVDFLIALQSGSLKVDHVTSLEEDESAIIKDHQELAIKLVQMNIKLIDGSLPDKDIVSLMRSSTIGTFDGGNVLIFYDVKASGEDAKRPDTRKPQLRKSHLERSIKLALHCRTPDHIHIHESDFFVLMDGGRHGNTSTLIGSLKDDADKAMPPMSLPTIFAHTCTRNQPPSPTHPDMHP